MMKLSGSVLRSVAAATVLAGAAGAQAQPVTFSFSGHGVGLSISSPYACADPVGCVDATVAGVADDWLGFGSPIPGSWDDAAGFTQSLSRGAISGLFSFTGLGGAPDFSGTFVGAFAGATGSGSSTIVVNLAVPSYVESGVFTLTPIPEPASWALMAASMLAVGAGVRRRPRRTPR